MNPKHLFPCGGRYETSGLLSRRRMLVESAGGFGGLALASLLQPKSVFASESRAAHPAKAKSIIFLYMSGGPSQLDLLDPKPLLKKLDGKPIPVSVEQRDVYGTGKVMASPYKFAKHGQSGAEVSELLPHLSGVVDDIAIVRSGVTNRIDHGEALLMMHTGRPIPGFPTIGSWITYALGTENQNLPSYVSMSNVK